MRPFIWLHRCSNTIPIVRSFVLFLLLVGTASLSASTILVVGDSLSAGFGIPQEKGWVSLLQNKLSQENKMIKVVNISASGDTTSNGLAKLPQALITHKPNVVIIELGANDGLRGLSLTTLEKNLSSLITLSQAAGSCVMLLSTPLPPNYGALYLTKFQQVFEKVATQHQALLVRAMLEGIADNPSLMQSDRLHPNENAQSLILNNIWPKLQTILECGYHVSFR